MKGRARAWVSTERLLAYMDGELSADEAASVERSSIESSENKRRLDRFVALRAALQAPAPELEQRDLVRALRKSADAHATPPRSGWAWLRFLRMAALPAALLLGIGSWHQLWPSGEQPPEGELRPKAGETSGGKRWAGVQVYHLQEGGTPARLGATLEADDGLLFAYTNLETPAFDHLMVFAVDAQGRVHWFYPALPATGPGEATSIAIAAGRAEVPLMELIHADLAPGPLAIYAAFTHGPLRTREVEGWLKSHPEGGTGFAPAGSAVSRVEAHVQRAQRPERAGASPSGTTERP